MLKKIVCSFILIFGLKRLSVPKIVGLESQGSDNQSELNKMAGELNGLLMEVFFF
jgi:hypothetical protein